MELTHDKLFWGSRNIDGRGFDNEAKELFEQEIEVPAGYRVAWLGMFENLQRARTHFAKLIPVTIVVHK